MPKPRKPENKGLPARWQFAHGAYYYRVPPGLEDLWEGKKRYRLGASLPEAYKEWATRLETTGNKQTTIGQLLDRYALEVIPTKAPKTQESNQWALKKLRPVFAAVQGHCVHRARGPRQSRFAPSTLPPCPRGAHRLRSSRVVAWSDDASFCRDSTGQFCKSG